MGTFFPIQLQMPGVEVAKMKTETYYVPFPAVFVASAGVHMLAQKDVRGHSLPPGPMF